MSRAFRKEVDANLTNLCKGLGYKNRKYEYVLKINENVCHTIFLNTTSCNGEVDVNPSVGVYYKDVDQLNKFICGTENNYIVATAWTLVQNLMPSHSGFKSWNFTEGEDNEGVYKDLLYNIQTYGVPFQKKLEVYENFFDAIYNKRCYTDREHFLPAMYYMEGKKELGLKVIEEFIENRLKSRIMTDEEYESEVATNKALKLPTDNISRVIEGGIEPYYLEYYERYKKLCNGEIVWERGKK
jgi:hypothetical protein